MPVRIGSIELTGLEKIHAEDERNLVQQRGPGQAGSLALDLGREPVVVVLEGLLLGDDPLASLEELRQAQTDALPLPFAADALAGTELTDVLIEALEIRQLAGYRERYRFHLRVREYTEPPENAASSGEAVNEEVDAEAEAWSDDAVAATAVVDEPETLVSAAADNPGLIDHLSATEVAGALQASSSGGGGAGLAGALGALAGVDPDKLNAVLTELAEAGGLGELITTLANDSINLLDELAGAELGAAAELVKAMSGGADFLAKLEDVGRRGAELSGVLATFDPSLGLTAVARSDGATARDVLARVSALIVAVDALLETEVANDLGDLARRLGIGGPLAAGFTELIEALELADAWLSKLKDPLNEVNDAAALFGGLLNVLATLGRVLAEPAFADANPDNAGLNAVNDVAASLSLITRGLPRYAEEVAPVRDALSGTISTAQTLQSQIGGSP